MPLLLCGMPVLFAHSVCLIFLAQYCLVGIRHDNMVSATMAVYRVAQDRRLVGSVANCLVVMQWNQGSFLIRFLVWLTYWSPVDKQHMKCV